ncbi:MAG: hypothetical protein J6K98_00930 [Clostridia bacterium]|nr:hypothetical protein [Clostridia bacterium]
MENVLETLLTRRASIWKDVCPDPSPEEMPEAGLMGENTTAEALGVSHVAGCYTFEEPYLQEGVRFLQRAGFHTVKLWLCASVGQYYPRKDGWPDCQRLAELVSDAAYCEVFNEAGIHTWFLESIPFSLVDFGREISVAEWQAIYDEFYDLAAYLLISYRGTGKRFVLQNWEGDWMYAGTFDMTSPTFEEPLRLQNFRQYLQCLQAAVTDARGSVQTMQKEDVYVFACAEVNLIAHPDAPGQPETQRFAVNQVIPHTAMDLYSFSNYQSWHRADVLSRLITHYRSRAPKSVAFGRYNIILGEYGVPEREFGTAYQQCIAAVHTRVMREEFHAPYHIYWQLFCNECCEENKRGQIYGQRGFWLVRPDQSLTPAYWWLRQALGQDASARFENSSALAFWEWLEGEVETADQYSYICPPEDKLWIHGSARLGIDCKGVTGLWLCINATAFSEEGVLVAYLDEDGTVLTQSECILFRQQGMRYEVKPLLPPPAAARFAEWRFDPPQANNWMIKGIYVQKGVEL